MFDKFKSHNAFADLDKLLQLFANYQIKLQHANLRATKTLKDRMSNHTIPGIELLLKCLACKPRQLKGEIFAARHLI